MNEIKIQPYVYPNTPQKPLGFYRKNQFYYMQENDHVLLVNSKDPLISKNCAGFLEGDNLEKITEGEFIEVLNNAIFEMNIFSKKFKME